MIAVSLIGRLPRAVTAALLLACAVIRPALAQTVDHQPFDALLKRHVVNGMVDYDAFRREPSFAAYLQTLGAQNPAALPRDEQLAFWINAYNAWTIQLINVHNERNSIRNINKTFGIKLKGPWSEPIATISGRTYTLDEIEHDIIRPKYGEPRIHFALVCAAMGCPPLRSEAYTGALLDRQLQEQGELFIRRSPGKNRVDLASRTWHHSLIFGYYKQDFGGSVQDAARFAARWYPAGSAERTLLESGTVRTRETTYDWTLNSQEQAKRLASGTQ
ncbi:MAG: DUF547 domain-containing protein [Gemmatimonadaceae bacterium]|nr:DUF547 domain-containing protein [Gemmatimonadaceae bacterium]